MKSLLYAAALFALFVSASDAGDAANAQIDEDYVASVREWRGWRLDRLRAADGFLNLAGLFWLREDRYTFGSGDDNDIVFPSTAANRIGNFEVTADGVVMKVLDGVEVISTEGPVQMILMRDDTTESPVTVRHGALAWVVIQRDGKYAVRLRDFEHPALDALPPIPYFDIDPSYRVEATLRYFDEPKVITVGTVIEGLGYNPMSPGIVEFEINGTPLQLEAYASGERLFFVFGDRTSGRETYGAGRFLYAEMPGEDGRTLLDFNLSYNPPCAFGDFSTCPIASPQNRLAVRVEAGEKFVPELHVGSLTH